MTNVALPNFYGPGFRKKGQSESSNRTISILDSTNPNKSIFAQEGKGVREKIFLEK
jgi:hypothetical protein